jgi:threonine synthase
VTTTAAGPHTTSLAVGQRSLGDPAILYPLTPVLTAGCPRTSTDDIAYPLEVEYNYGDVDLAMFDQPPLPGLDRWAPLLPPLAPGLSMGEGGTPLVSVPRVAAWAGFDGELYIKDESRNPTWSHKDRLNLCTVSAAVHAGATGVAVASSGNHGAAASAYAARAGLACVVLTSAATPPAVVRFMRGYGAVVVLRSPTISPWPVLGQLADRLGFHPMSNVTPAHTGHPYGPEGYKTIAYEIFLQLGRRVPAAVFVPTGYGEQLYGVWKGFAELHRLGIAPRTPAIISCEPAARGPLAQALAENKPAVEVEPRPTEAYAIACTVNGYRGVVAVRDSGGQALTVSDEELHAARTEMARSGLWAELSSAAGVAALAQATREGARFDGPVVCISTSSGFKDKDGEPETLPETDGTWDSMLRALRDHYGLRL